MDEDAHKEYQKKIKDASERVNKELEIARQMQLISDKFNRKMERLPDDLRLFPRKKPGFIPWIKRLYQFLKNI